MIPNLLQTQYLKRHITMEPRAVPVAGPFSGVSVYREWLDIVDPDIPTVRITQSGINAFWRGVKKHGTKEVMGKARVKSPRNTPPTGGTPIAMTA